ncbi:hypothetical protein [Deinococcus sp. SL84]|uniref:hypothetical protein n=1 Tax=Deinococcus sp. SL84 TaxID=2994663 RepID=UPI002276B596|nr:hypothetical protein [Deinococcus sp. SL84]MCY1703944.1 hypothetical protein [Deinococcus sp. SL84]
MPLLFVHGVAIRQEDAPEFKTLHSLTSGVDWTAISALLREYVAPVMRPDAPQDVSLEWLYWGDLGATYRAGGRFRGTFEPESPPAPHPLEASAQAQAQWLEDRLLPQTPAALWPATIEAAALTAEDQTVRLLAAELSEPARSEVLLAAVEARRQNHTTLRSTPQLSALLLRWEERRRGRLQQAFRGVRRPLEDFGPIFLGDALTYFTLRGTPEQPGPVLERVLAALQQADATAKRSGEPLVVLSHSLGGQLVYDVLSSVVPARPDLADLQVDLWCAVGSQLGLFKELGLMLEDHFPASTNHADASPLLNHLGYLWNVWSYGDLLSFRAEGSIPSAHDAPFPLGGQVQDEHLAYFHQPHFYAALAAKLRSLTR